MKKLFSIVFIIVIFLGCFFLKNYTFVNADNENEVKTDIKKNADSYWSTKNKPLFYGATKITLGKGSIDKFDILDSRFRIFAKDFEDGDLTKNIIASGEVNLNQTGTYQIKYEVIDSHNNISTLTVPVIVTEEESKIIKVERTLYTIPSVWNMDLAGFSRCNYGDRQILGVYLSQGSSLKARVISADTNITTQFLTNDSYKESSISLPKDGSWVTLTNISSKDGLKYDSVPLFTSTVLSKEQTNLEKVFKVELEYDDSVKPLTYYHYGDDEANYFNTWKNNTHSYSVIENEVLTIVVPFSDVDKLVNHNLYENGFKTLTQFLEYYKKVVDKMDEYMGLDLNPSILTDQNVRTKYLARANAHGAGAAYYSGNHIGVNSSSISSFFQMNWGGLHEIAHGYQGYLGKGKMDLGETGNNILGHYIQIDKSIYFHPGDWLGDLAKTEENRNKERLEGKKFTQIEVGNRLYMIVNLFDYFEGGNTYAKIFSWYRNKLNEGQIIDKEANQDIYIEAIADIYHVNITPYMEAWNLDISDTTKEKVYSKEYPLLTILKDSVNDITLTKIMENEHINKKYSLVDNDIYNKYQITGDLTLNIKIDDINKIRGKVMQIRQGNKIIKSIKITSNQMKISNLGVGAYYIQMPVHSDYMQQRIYVEIKQNQDNVYDYVYENLEKVDYNNYLSLRLLGNYDTYGYKLTFSDNYKKATIEFGQANYSNYQNVEVRISDEKGNIISDEKKSYDADGNLIENGIYFNFKKGNYSIDIKKGYIIEVIHSGYQSKGYGSQLNRVVWNSTLTNQVISSYDALAETTKYIVEDNGIRREDMTLKQMQEINYSMLRQTMIDIIESYKNTVTEEELNNKNINFTQKANVIYAYKQLNSNDQKNYQEFINQIIAGGKPIITGNKNLEYTVGQQVNLYSLISANDNEDGLIEINSESTKISTNLDLKKPGNYFINYQVSDSDQNISTYQVLVKIIGKNSNTEITDKFQKDPEAEVEAVEGVETVENLSTVVSVPNTMKQSPTYMYIIGIVIFLLGLTTLGLTLKSVFIKN